MSSEILVLTQPNDVHAFAVAEAVRRKGGRAALWQTSDFPTRSRESVLFADGRKTIHVRTPHLDDLGGRAFDVVWNRRPTYVIDREVLHPADVDFAELCCRNFRRSLLQVAAPDAFWVNPLLAALRAKKMVQLDRAEAAGLEIPATLFSNDPDEIRAFIRRHGGTVIFKNQRVRSWRDAESTYFPFATLLQESQLVDDDILQTTPGIFQEPVSKAFEVRATVIGRRVLSAKVLSQATRFGKVDWRRQPPEGLAWLPYELPGTVEQACRNLLDALGLVFGCFDFIVTPEGRHVFLEVNQMGQFLFVEHGCPQLPLLDAFAELLIQGDSDFSWDPDHPELHYRDLRPDAVDELEKARSRHVEVPSEFYEESPAVPGA